MTTHPASMRTERPGYRLYVAQLTSLTRLSTHFVRARFTSDDFAHFGTGRKDQRIKVIYPLADGTLPDLGPLDPVDPADPGWYARWRACANEARPPFRTYTVREVDPAARTLDIDYVVHGDTGVSGRWLNRAQPGDRVYIAGPDGRSIHSDTGIDFQPGTATRVLLAGDETAVPAIGAILERLPAAVEARAFLEVPSTDDILDLAIDPHVVVKWLPREGMPVGERLHAELSRFVADHPGYLEPGETVTEEPAVDADPDALVWDAPTPSAAGGFYAWLAGEAGAVKRLRRLLVTEHRVDRSRVAFMGYWRLGRAESA